MLAGLDTALTAVLGFAELLRMRSHGPLGQPRYAEFAADIAGSGKHMLDLVEDVQRFTAATGGGASIQRQPLLLSGVAERAARLLRGEEEARGVRIHVEVSRDLLVSADPRALLQLLLNLIGNAVK